MLQETLDAVGRSAMAGQASGSRDQKGFKTAVLSLEGFSSLPPLLPAAVRPCHLALLSKSNRTEWCAAPALHVSG